MERSVQYVLVTIGLLGYATLIGASSQETTGEKKSHLNNKIVLSKDDGSVNEKIRKKLYKIYFDNIPNKSQVTHVDTYVKNFTQKHPLSSLPKIFLGNDSKEHYAMMAVYGYNPYHSSNSSLYSVKDKNRVKETRFLKKIPLDNEDKITEEKKESYE